METSDVLIIGAGATGLMAAYKLTQKGKKVTVLEARNRTGGRIHTITNGVFKHAELGAEFIHGDLPVTLNILKEAGIEYYAANGEMVSYKQGKFSDGGQFIENWDLLMERLNQLKTDTNIYDFLQKEFPDEQYQSLRDGVWRYVSGFDNADPRKASAFALRKEWQNGDEDAQHRLNEGYCSLINYFVKYCKGAGNQIYLNSAVKDIHWKQGEVMVSTVESHTYTASQLIIAMPLGVLQVGAKEKGAITFHPPILEQINAIKTIGFGSVIKFLLEFDEPFWEKASIKKLAGKSLKEMGYLLSDEQIPTWWTQHPQNSPLLTGWIGGPAADDLRNNTQDELLQKGLQSLSNIFKIEVAELKGKIRACNIINWITEPFTRGSYSYDTVASPAARKVLNEPVENTLFFAGEYMYEGTAIGTVEAALTGGMNVAEKLIG